MSKWKEMAERSTILRVVVGSQAYGLNLDKSDRDEKGICVEDFESSFNLSGKFEQYEFRTAVERTGDRHAKSQPGDLDLTIYSLEKALRLMLNGNPNMIELLFIRGDSTIKWTRTGTDLQDLAPAIVSKRAGGAYLGYMKGQRNRYFDNDGDGSRKELIDRWGYDVKAASHVVRLGYQGVELLKTGKLELPIRGAVKDVLMAIKQGHWSLQSVLDLTLQLEDEIKSQMEYGPLQSAPDTSRVEQWMQDTYKSTWGSRQVMLRYQGVACEGTIQ